jgi:hypothetical protein
VLAGDADMSLRQNDVACVDRVSQAAGSCSGGLESAVVDFHDLLAQEALHP